MQPKVSVVMSVYNGARYVKEAVDSILAQTFADFEFIIIDDGSTDDTWSVLHNYADRRIRLAQNGQNIGLTRSLNRGLSWARGVYIARMDADDISLPSRFERQVNILDAHSAIGLLGSDVLVLDMATGRQKRRRYPKTDCAIKWQLLFKNSFSHSAIMFRRELYDALEGYDERLTYAQDYEFTSRLATSCTVANITQPLLIWRESLHQISVHKLAEQTAIAAQISYQNIRRLVGDHWLVTPRDIANMQALWSRHHPQLHGQSLAIVINNVELLFNVFCQDYERATPFILQRQQDLTTLHDSVQAHLTFHAAIRSYRANDLSMAWRYLRRSLWLKPTGKKIGLAARLFSRSLLGEGAFRHLKDYVYGNNDE
jgi:hypothetical protein